MGDYIDQPMIHYVTYIFLLICTWLLMSIGLLINAFIVARNFIQYVKVRTLQTTDILMASLGMVRIVFLILYAPSIYSISNGFKVPKKFLEYRITITQFVTCCSLWWGTVLGVFYCVKITTYSNRLFLRLKMNISRMVPWLLLVTMVLSFLSNLPCIWLTYSALDTNSTQDINYVNMTLVNYFGLVVISFGGSFIPFLVFCVAIILLILSLLRHTRNMSRNVSGFTKPHLVIHIRALINMSSLLLFFVLFFIGSNLFHLVFYLQHPLYGFLCCICCISIPALHSMVLIASNGSLKRSFLAFLCFAIKKKMPQLAASNQ